MKRFISKLLGKPRARFVNLIPGVEKAYPIVSAGSMRPAWLKKAAEAWKEQQSLADPTQPWAGGNVVRCPGVTDLLKHGYVITAPFDFTITTDKNDPMNFRWNCAMGMSINVPGDSEPPIGSHPFQQLGQFMPMRKDTLQAVVKVQTFWRYEATEDVVFLQIPYPYPDHNDFTAAYGVFDSTKSFSINIQLFWHNLDGTVLVKAGTPLSQLIPIPRNYAIDLIIDEANEKDYRKNRASKYLITHEYNKQMKRWYEQAGRIFKWK